MFRTTLDTPVGTLRLFADNFALYRIAFPCEEIYPPDGIPAPDEPDGHPLLRRAKAQLTEYFQGDRRNFDLPLRPQGTAFQQAVWSVMQEIPFGETKSYGEIAAALGNANKARAVGGAANKNPLPVVIPCHRVIGSSGSLTGFSGGLNLKQFLFDLEKKIPHCIP